MTVETIGFIGGGHMAEALISGILKARVCLPGKVYVSDIRPERLEYLRECYGVRTTGNNAELVTKAKVLVLSVKPQTMKEMLEGITNSVGEDALIISIAAGIPISLISSILGDRAIVRVMPNMAAWVAQGASALYPNTKARAKLNAAEIIFASVGKVVTVEDEGLIDSVTAVSGSGPAYFFLMMQEMIKAGVALGLSEADAQTLTLQTAKGAAMIAEEAIATGETPGQLCAQVATPGGTTEAAINVFHASGFGETVSRALQRASERCRELSAG
jgi:pyrroline-5-carboxylate reductase